MDIHEYHAHPAIGKTTLDLIARDPHLVEWSKMAPVDPDKKDAGDIGDAFHAMLLEPDRYTASYAVQPKLDMRTNAGKEQAAAFARANADKVVLTEDDDKMLKAMRDSAMAHPIARALIEAEGQVEQSFFWTDESTGIQCKCRPDKLLPDRRLVDVKTTASLAKFAYSVEEYRYYVQAPWYSDGVEAATTKSHGPMIFLVVQKTQEFGRYPVGVFTLPEDLILFGRQTYRRDLDRYARFIDGYGREIQELTIHNRFIDHCVENLEITT